MAAAAATLDGIIDTVSGLQALVCACMHACMQRPAWGPPALLALPAARCSLLRRAVTCPCLAPAVSHPSLLLQPRMTWPPTSPC